MLSYITQYIKRSRFLRVLLFVPIWIRRKILAQQAVGLMRYYDEVVHGGHLIIAPANFPGRFKIDATSDLAKRVIKHGRFEPELTALLDRFSDVQGDVVNIGANIGFYSVFFATKFQNIEKVIAIEPNPEAFELLQWNISNNEVESRVDALQVCIGEKSAQVDFAYVPGKSEYSSIGEIAHSAVSGRIQHFFKVDVSPLASAVRGRLSNPQLIFVDTEGAELLVLRGAEDIIEQSSPLLFFECEDNLLQNFGHSSQMLESYVSGLGYDVRDASAPKFGLAHPFTGVAVAVPAGRKDWLEILQDSPAL